MTSLARRLWRWIGGMFAAVAILLALLVGAFRIVVAHAPDYRQPIAEWASGLLGLPVEIDQLDVRFGLGGPELIFGGATIYSADRSGPLFSAARASLSLDVTQLIFRWRAVADTFTVDDLTLDLARSADGDILFFDRPLAGLPAGDGSPIDEVRIRNATVIFRDRMKGGRTWILEDLDAVLEPDRDGARLEGRFSPPQGMAQTASFWATFGDGRPLRAYFAASGLNLSALDQVPGMPAFVPRDGAGDVRIWLDAADREISKVSAEMALRDLTLAFGEEEPADYQELGGRLEWDRRPGGWRGRLEDLHVRRPGGEWRSARIAVETTAATDTQPGGVLVDADFLRLEDLRPLVPLIADQDLREMLAATSPSGDLSGLSASATAPRSGETGFRVEVQAEFDRLSLAAHEKIPGINGFSGRLRSDPRGGRVQIRSRDLSLDFPRLFRDPLRFDSVSGLLVWSRGSDGLTVIGDGLTADNRDLALEGGFRLRLGASDDPGGIDVQATVRNVDLASKSRYLPVGIMPPKIVAWLDSAIVAGRAPLARLNLQGPLKGFPYPGGEGTFEVSFGTEDMVLDYASGWPSATELAADVLFRNQGMTAEIRSGRLGGVEAEAVNVGIPVLREGRLTIVGGARGPLAEVLSYAQSSPLRQVIGPALEDVRVEEGDAEVSVDLLLPLQDLAARDVVVGIDLRDASVGYGQMIHRLEDAEGRLGIHNAEVSATGITGTFLGEPVTVDVGANEDGVTVATARAVMTARALTESLGLPLEAYLEGASATEARAYFPRRGTSDQFHIRMESSLAGMAITLPDPVRKSADEVVPLWIDVEFPQPDLAQWNMRFGDRLSAAAGFATGEGRMQFARGTILGGVGEMPRLSEDPGLAIRGKFRRLAALEWLGVRFGDRTEGRLEDVLTSIDLETEDFRFGGQRFGAVACRLEQRGDHWWAALEGDTLQGTVDAHMLRGSAVPMVLDMQRLYLDDDTGDGSEDGGGGGLDPVDVPSMRLAAEDFRMEGLRLGRLEVEIKSVPNGFLLERVHISGPDYVMEATGRSLLGFGQDESRLKVNITTDDLGAAMEFVGFQRTVEASSATLAADLSWTGGWPQHLLDVAQGTADLDIDSGSLSEVKPGAGRMFGLLSVQALPRRLTLDFRDVFKKGFFFDELRGDFTIRDGKAFTDNLVFRSPAADIGIVGSVDLTERVYDQTAIVSAEIGNTLPLVGAIAAGPAIGAGLFVLKEIFKEPLRGMVNVQYRITGPWEDPVVEKVGAGENNVPAPSAAETGGKGDS